MNRRRRLSLRSILRRTITYFEEEEEEDEDEQEQGQGGQEDQDQDQEAKETGGTCSGGPGGLDGKC